MNTRKSIETSLLGVLLTASACTGQLGGGGDQEERGTTGSEAGNEPGEGALDPASPEAGDGSGAIGADGRLIAGRGLRRLSVREVENTLDALFPELAEERLRFPLEGYEIFDNDEAHTDNGLAFVENVALVMQDIAERARNNTALWARIETCEPLMETSSCLGEVYDRWAPLLLRREGNESERSELTALSSLDIGDRSDAVAVVFEALLRHSDFLHRVELGVGGDEVKPLSSREILGRLSFFLWAQAPDEPLLALAGDRDLSVSGERRALAEQMLADERAKRAVADYHAQWVGYSTMDRQGVGDDMWNESAQLVERVVFGEEGTYDDLFTSMESYITPELAAHYDLPPLGATGWVSVDGTGRAGLFGHGSFLSSFANVGDTSPTKRGKNVQNRMLCRDIQLPEASEVDVDAEPEEGQCYTEFLKDVHAQGGCATCHQLLDGVGFGLDAFDRLGAARTHEAEKEHCSIDGEGQLDGRSFTGPEGLGTLLVEHDEFVPCVSTQLVRFYSGFDSRQNPQARNWATALSETFDANQRDFRGLLLALVESPEFAFVVPR